MSEKYLIKIESFEGPFDILLEMIQKKEMSINDISLSSITDDYIFYIKNNKMELFHGTYFIWTAATLMIIKSRSLLPKMALNREDEEDIKELKSKLNFLSEIRKNSTIIKKLFLKNILYKKVYKKKNEIKFRPDEGITLKNILLSLDKLISRSPIVEKMPEVRVKKIKNLSEVIEEINHKISTFLEMNFNELTNSLDRKESAISFLAILELYRNGIINLKQENAFGKIKIEKNSIN